MFHLILWTIVIYHGILFVSTNLFRFILCYRQKPVLCRKLPYRRRPPRPQRHKQAIGCQLPVNIRLVIPTYLMCLSALQGHPHLQKQQRKTNTIKTFFFNDTNFYLSTGNKMEKRRKAKHLLPLFLPGPSTPLAMNAEEPQQGPHQMIFDSDARKFLLDSGASNHLWARRQDFTSYRSLTRTEQEKEAVLGVSGTKVTPLGIGTVSVTLEDDLNKLHSIELRDVRHLPSAPLNIVVPQMFIQQRQAEGDGYASCSISASGITLNWLSDSNQQVSKFVPLNKNNVGICFTASGFRRFRAFMGLCMPAVAISDDEDSISDPTPPENEGDVIGMETKDDKHPIIDVAPSRTSPETGITTDFATNPSVLPQVIPDEPLLRADQDSLMDYHDKLGHAPFPLLKALAEKGVIPRRLAKVSPPKCPSCLYGKAHRKPWRTHKVDPKIKQSTIPGAVVSMDQLESPVPGFVPIGKGQPTTRRYRGATVFVDHASDFTYVHMMTALTTAETIEAKHAFERLALQHGVRVRHYHCDNGRFADKAFLTDVKNALQTISFCGVGAHHQNGIAERRIRDISESARTMLLHAAHRWPKTITSNLWPQAVKHATNIRNALPRIGKQQSPISIFSNTDVEPNTKHFHTFGCPVYVLQAPLQTLKPHPKWEERSRVGIYLCHSPHHAASVPLILSTTTGLVSPQFHCIYDDKFETVKREQHDTTIWKTKAHFVPATEKLDQRNDHLVSLPSSQPSQRLPTFGANIPNALLRLPDIDTTATTPEPPEPIEPLPQEPSKDPIPVPPTLPETSTTSYPVSIAPTGRTRTGRTIRTPSRFAFVAYHCCHLAQTVAQNIADFHPLALLQMMGAIHQPEGYPDAMPLHVALAQEDRDQFLKAMAKELKQHADLKHWKIVHRAQVPKSANPIPMVWTLRRKRDPAGNIIKWKARLCAGGHKQIFGDTYWTTFSPVVAWSTVRCVFILALVLGWKMRSIDFVMAYTQAKVKTDIYMTLPKGTTLPNADPTKHFLKLQQNLYGLKDGQVTWHDHIKNGLLQLGYKQSTVDPCLFIKGSVILILYVDDAALFSPHATAIDNELQLLRKSFELTDEGDVVDYLGTRFIKHNNGSVELQQQKAIDNCLTHLGMGLDKDNVKQHDTPAEANKILHADPAGSPRKQQWNYRAVVGSLNYIQAMTRPDLSYAVHQCARFCNAPKLSHEIALKRICRYLRSTRSQGLIFKPNLQDGFKCFVDADWAGNWNKDQPNELAGTLSRTGYIIMYAGCPIVWGSKMQTLVALSSTEAEIIALSTALREVIHLQHLLRELRNFGIPIPLTKSQIHCRTFEDNAACIEVATSEPKIRPRTKHLAVRLFHFRQHVENGDISIHHVNTGSQLADIFTKPLPRVQFKHLRDQILSWATDPMTQHEGV